MRSRVRPAGTQTLLPYWSELVISHRHPQTTGLCREPAVRAWQAQLWSVENTELLASSERYKEGGASQTNRGGFTSVGA